MPRTLRLMIRVLAVAALLGAAFPPGTFACPTKGCGEGANLFAPVKASAELPCCQHKQPVKKCCCQKDTTPPGALSEEAAKALAPAPWTPAALSPSPALAVALPRAEAVLSARASSPPGFSSRQSRTLRC